MVDKLKSKGHGHQRQFALEGRFSGFVPHSKKPFKYIRLTTADGEYRVKLPKYLQLEVVAQFTPGDWVQVVGTCKERSDGTFRFKAENLIQSKPTGQRVDVTSMANVADVLNAEDTVTYDSTRPLPNRCEDSSNGKNTSDNKRPIKVLVCGKSKCMKRGGKAICQYLEALKNDQDLGDRIMLKQTGCMDRCKSGPNLVVMPDKAKYSRVTPEELEDLLHRHL
jgi:(2Fe-2S) ferredoxin